VEIDERGEIRINIFDESGMVGVMEEGNEINYLLKDHLGSTRVVADEAGEKRGELNYSDFGETTTSRDVESIRYRYTGQEWDEEAEEYNYLAREYDPAVGRFNSLDPARQEFSPYVYVGNNPINFADPDGKTRYRVTLGSILSSPSPNENGALVKRSVTLDSRQIASYNYCIPKVRDGRVNLEKIRGLGRVGNPDGRYKFAMSTEGHVFLKKSIGRDLSNELVCSIMRSETSLVGTMVFDHGKIIGVEVKSHLYEIGDTDLIRGRVEKMLATIYKDGRSIPRNKIDIHIKTTGSSNNTPTCGGPDEVPPTYEEAILMTSAHREPGEMPPTYEEVMGSGLGGERIGEGARLRLPRTPW